MRDFLRRIVVRILSSVWALIARARVWILRRPRLVRILRADVPSAIISWLKTNTHPVVLDARGRKAAPISSSDESNWADYSRLRERIASARASRMAGLHPRRPALISVREEDVLARARTLHFIVPDRPIVSIVIPVHNNARLTVECLLSLREQTGAIDHEIIIVDDGSDEDTQHVLDAMPDITIERNSERQGFTVACNRGAARARGTYVLFLNNDVQVTPGWLQALLDTYAQAERVGAVGPMVLSPDGRLQEAGACINLDGTATQVGYADDPESPRYNYLREVDYCSAVCLLMPLEIFHRVGGLDQSYSPAYYEDVDLCFKVRQSGYRIMYNPGSRIVHHMSATTAAIDAAFKTQTVAVNRQKFITRWRAQIDALNEVRLIAFYLPQFHAIPENDLWWGKGYTEWTAVAKARPNYVGHYQPQIPADLGFYDLRVPDVMDQQAELAKRYGIYGFCHYYYWFHGHRLLELPLERMLETGKPDFPFCLCWANENWTRTWDGDDQHVLIAQEHSEADDRAVILDIIRFMRHPNYIKVDGKPLFIVYRVNAFPDIRATARLWRDVCRREGIGEIHLVMLATFENSYGTYDPRDLGLDAAAQFPPHYMGMPVKVPGRRLNPAFRGMVLDYEEEVFQYTQRQVPAFTEYRTVMPGWDNTPRKQDRPFIFDRSSAGAYQAWLEQSIRLTREQHPSGERLVFINAWNEWGEGAHLEPDLQTGHCALEATRAASEYWLLKPHA